VVIRGTVTITNHPKLGKTPDSGGTVIFQKVGCPSCYVGTTTDFKGNYEILVGDGKYKVIIRDPTSPDFDMLIPEQERFIDTQSLDAQMHVRTIFEFNVSTRLPKI
jgi:hypothetical protein